MGAGPRSSCALTVFGPVWLLGTAQRRLDRRLPWGAASSRYAYGAFILARAGGVAGSFALAGLLINRVPGMARIL